MREDNHRPAPGFKEPEDTRVVFVHGVVVDEIDEAVGGVVGKLQLHGLGNIGIESVLIDDVGGVFGWEPAEIASLGALDFVQPKCAALITRDRQGRRCCGQSQRQNGKGLHIVVDSGLRAAGPVQNSVHCFRQCFLYLMPTLLVKQMSRVRRRPRNSSHHRPLGHCSVCGKVFT